MCVYIFVYIYIFHKDLWDYSRAVTCIYKVLNRKRGFRKEYNDGCGLAALSTTRHGNHMIIGETILNNFHRCPFSKVHVFHNTTIVYVDVFKKVTYNELFGKMTHGSIVTKP